MSDHDKRGDLLSAYRVNDNTELIEMVLALARAIRSQRDLWAIFERVGDKLEMTDLEMSYLAIFSAGYFCGLGRRTPRDAGMSSPVLRMLAAGRVRDLECDDVRTYLKANCWVRLRPCHSPMLLPCPVSKPC